MHSLAPRASQSAWARAQESDSEEPAPPEPKPAQTRKYDDLYTEYVEACSGESVRTKAPSYAAFEKSLEKQRKAAESKLEGNSVRYEVRMKNGEPKLIAVIKKVD